jgi:FHS family Na+ dependent glucose MFS transporter 1
MWGKENTPFMQLAHFAYGLGCFLGPIIAEPFLLPEDEPHTSHHNLRIQYGYAIGGALNLVFWGVFVVTYFGHKRNKPHPTRQPAGARVTSAPPESGSQINSPIAFKTGYPCTDSSSAPPASSMNHLIPEQMHISTSTRRWIVFVSALFVHVTYGLELSFGILLPVYVVKSPLGLSKSTASFLTSLYWACFTFPKLLAAACSSRVSARTLLCIELAILCVANLFLIPFGTNCEWALWVGTALIGCGVSSIFPSLLGHLELMFPLSGKVTSLFTTFSCLGEFVIPMLVGVYIETNPTIFLHITLLYSILSVVFFAILMMIEMKVKHNHELQSKPYAAGPIMVKKPPPLSIVSNMC